MLCLSITVSLKYSKHTWHKYDCPLPWSSPRVVPLCTDNPWNWTTTGVRGDMDFVTSNTGCPSRISAVMFGSKPSLHFFSPSAACRLLRVLTRQSSVAIRKRTQLHCLIFRLLSSSWIMSKEPNLHRICGKKSHTWRCRHCKCSNIVTVQMEVYFSCQTSVNNTTRHVMICVPHQILIERSNQGGWAGQSMSHAWAERREGVGEETWREGLLEDPGADERIVLKKQDLRTWIGLIWLIIGPAPALQTW